MPKIDAALVIEARRVARLQRRQTEARRQLKAIAAELKLAKKNLSALAASTSDPFQQSPPLRLFGESGGAKASGE